MLEPVFVYPDGKTPSALSDRKKLTLSERENLVFFIAEGEPTLPILTHGKIWHEGWDIPTRYCVDTDQQCWADNAHGHPLSKISKETLLNMFERVEERLNLEKILGMAPSYAPCPTCGHYTKKK